VPHLASPLTIADFKCVMDLVQVIGGIYGDKNLGEVKKTNAENL
jgi:hypothetical protein